jgi:hypothetical protein
LMKLLRKQRIKAQKNWLHKKIYPAKIWRVFFEISCCAAIKSR